MFKKYNTGGKKHGKELYDSRRCCRRLSVSKSKAYKIVRQLNKELEEKGIITVAGRVCTSYFRKKVMYSGD